MSRNLRNLRPVVAPGQTVRCGWCGGGHVLVRDFARRGILLYACKGHYYIAALGGLAVDRLTPCGADGQPIAHAHVCTVCGREWSHADCRWYFIWPRRCPTCDAAVAVVLTRLSAEIPWFANGPVPPERES